MSRDDLEPFLREAIAGAAAGGPGLIEDLRAPIGNQEVWAAGVTYYRSRDARMEESKSPAAAIFTIAFMARSVRSFSSKRRRIGWWVLAARWPFAMMRSGLFRNRNSRCLSHAGGKIIGYTVGNDMSSRDIEGENPLYLPKRKYTTGAVRWVHAFWCRPSRCRPRQRSKLKSCGRGELASPDKILLVP